MDDLLALDLVDDLGLNAGANNQRRSDHGAVAAEHQDVVELNLFASVRSQFLDPEHVAGLNLVLLAAGLENRKHASFPLSAASCGPRTSGVSAFLGKATADSAPL